MPDIFTALHDDHDDLAKALTGLTVGDESEFACVSADLQAHWEAEENSFYSTLEGDEEAKPLITQAKKDHQEARSLMLGLVLHMEGKADPADTLDRLREALSKHFEWEEKVVFKTAGRVLTGGQSVSMAEEFLRQRQVVKGRLRASRPY